MQTKTVIGIDIGGTSISAGYFANNKIEKRYQLPTGAERPLDEVLETLYKVIEKLKDETTTAIGIGVPGYIDSEKGEIKLINNIPSFRGLKLKDEVEKRFNLPVFVDNDANCFALGEYYFEQRNHCKNMVALTLGTGLGGGVVIKGNTHAGIFGGAGEFGCISYLDSNFEDYCSSKFFNAKYNTEGKVLYEKAENGDAEALRIFEEFGSHIGNLILQIMYSLSPEKVIIGGSIAKASKFFMGGINKVIDTFPVDLIKQNFKVEIADLEEPGIHGAAALCMQQDL